MNEEDYDFFSDLDYSMMFSVNRLNSFKDWPFQEDCKCTPEKMAESGFYFCPTQREPDLVRCYACYKELDGWQPEDEPWEEHKSHSPLCPVLKYQKPENDLTLHEFMDIAKQKEINRVKKLSERDRTKIRLLQVQVEQDIMDAAKRAPKRTSS